MAKNKFSLKNKIVLITGASSGIGAACAERFAEEGAKLLLCARRIEKLNVLAEELTKKYKITAHCFQLDVSNEKDVNEKLMQLPEQWQAIDILINNAGLARGLHKIQEGLLQDWHEMIDTNLKGLLYVTRQLLPAMVKRNTGHIINIGSIAGHEVYPKGNVYCASKHAVKALSQALRIDLSGTKIRVTEIDPGMVQTEFSLVRFRGDDALATAPYKGLQPLTPEDIADAIIYCTNCPPHVNISEMLIMPTAQAAATVVHREGSNA